MADFLITYIINAKDYFKKNSFIHLLSNFAYSILLGVTGTILLTMFLLTLLPLFYVKGFIPWIIAFNAAVTGYSLLIRNMDRLEFRRISSMGAGLLNGIISCVILTIIFFYLGYEDLFGRWSLIFCLTVCIVCSELGAMLAIKYLRLREQDQK